MIYTTQATLATALVISADSAHRRCRGLPSLLIHGIKNYHLADLIPALRRAERAPNRLRALFDSATVRDSVYVGGTVDQAGRLIAVLDPAARHRLFAVQAQFTANLATSMQSSEIFSYLEALRVKLILHPQVMRSVILNDPFPEMSTLSVPFAITNARMEMLYNHKEVA